MPNRMLRDWTASDLVNQLDFRDEVFFVRLIMKADDFGRFSANPKLLRSLLFPLKDGLRDTDISRSIAACKTAGLIRLYAFENKPLLEIVDFGQRLQQKTSKYPSPDDENCNPPEHTVKNGGSPTEVEEKRSRREVTLTKAQAQSQEEIEDFCESMGLPRLDGAILWLKWDATDWCTGGQKIKDWRGTIRQWIKAGYMPSQKGKTYGNIQNIGAGAINADRSRKKGNECREEGITIPVLKFGSSGTVPDSTQE